MKPDLKDLFRANETKTSIAGDVILGIALVGLLVFLFQGGIA